MKIAHECLASAKKDMLPLLDKHWKETEPNQETIMLDPDWKEYSRLDSSGILRIFTAREKGQLIGYCVLMISTSVHHKGHLFAGTDVVYIHPDFRRGSTGSDLIRFAESHCKDNGVSLMTLNMKTDYPFDSLMLKMGFNLLERVYHKCFLGK
jgi:GNAT superfamily N-acetyltransferase|tara:strand:- start:1674 stop:2129 length:456 start_codon:yes stop_codon:yes gene_type:complete